MLATKAYTKGEVIDTSPPGTYHRTIDVLLDPDLRRGLYTGLLDEAPSKFDPQTILMHTRWFQADSSIRRSSSPNAAFSSGTADEVELYALEPIAMGDPINIDAIDPDSSPPKRYGQDDYGQEILYYPPLKKNIGDTDVELVYGYAPTSYVRADGELVYPLVTHKLPKTAYNALPSTVKSWRRPNRRQGKPPLTLRDVMWKNRVNRILVEDDGDFVLKRHLARQYIAVFGGLSDDTVFKFGGITADEEIEHVQLLPDTVRGDLASTLPSPPNPPVQAVYPQLGTLHIDDIRSETWWKQGELPFSKSIEFMVTNPARPKLWIYQNVTQVYQTEASDIGTHKFVETFPWPDDYGNPPVDFIHEQTKELFLSGSLKATFWAWLSDVDPETLGYAPRAGGMWGTLLGHFGHAKPADTIGRVLHRVWDLKWEGDWSPPEYTIGQITSIPTPVFSGLVSNTDAPVADPIYPDEQTGGGMSNPGVVVNDRKRSYPVDSCSTVNCKRFMQSLTQIKHRVGHNNRRWDIISHYRH